MHSGGSQAPAHSAAGRRCIPLRHSDVSCVILPRLGASDAAPAARIPLPARTAAPRKPHPPAIAPRSTALANSTQHHQRIASVRKQPLTAKLPQMHAAYHGGPATSAASSFRDSVPATLPQLLRCHCLHAPPPLGPPLANPHQPLQPRAQPPQPAARNIIHAQPAFASTRSQRSCRRCTQHTSEVQRRQLRHLCETRCQRRCPS
jgi:hypothetical protein